MPRRPEWITADYLQNMTRCLPIGDIWFLPRLIIDFKTFTDIHRLPSILKNWAEKIDGLGFLARRVEEFEKIFNAFSKNHPMEIEFDERDIEQMANNLFMMSLIQLKEIYWKYFRECNGNFSKPLRRLDEPGWIADLPKPVQGDLRATGAIRRFDPYIFPELPFTGVGYLIRDGEFSDQIAKALYLWRLQEIAQLSNLIDPTPSHPLRFTHTRLVHSFDVYALITLILFNNRFSLPRGFFKNGCSGGLLHDIATSSGGDGTKMVDPTLFCEEKNFSYYLDLYRRNWEKVCRKFGLDEKLIIEMINGLGILGEILDIADKLAYVGRDVSVYLSRYNPNNLGINPQRYYQVSDFSRSHPFFCSAWDSVRIAEGKVFFENPKALADALQARAFMQRDLYFNERSRSFESILGNIILKYMHSKGKLRREDLLQKNDRFLEGIVARFSGIESVFFSGYSLGELAAETYATMDSARRREWELFESGNILVAIEDTRGKIKPATDFLVRSPDDSIRPFSEAFPAEASKIHQTISLKRPIYLYYLKNTKFNPDFLAKLQAFRQKEMERRI
jgi:HD superfamily phosphohydrolase